MKTPLTVFVCSTYSDLSEERGAVLDAVRRLQLQHDSMEFFGARAHQPIETCLEEVRRSNILVVIVGHRYGTVVPELGVSFSEAEYIEGYQSKKPCLVYIRSDDVPVLPKHMERDPDNLRLLEAWKATLRNRHTIAPFQHSHDLAVQVTADLSRTISELEQAARNREQALVSSPVQLLDEVAKLVSHAIEQGVSEVALLSSIRRTVSTIVSDAQHRGPAVFLSYSRQDMDIVSQVAAGLRDAGIEPWIDVLDIEVGSNFPQEIERGLDSSDFVLFFISPSSVQSQWAQKELQSVLYRQVAGESQPIILPVLLEHSAEVPPLLRDVQWLDMTDGDVDKAVDQLVRAIYGGHRLEKNPDNDEGVA
jgi:hypothetical protein